MQVKYLTHTPASIKEVFEIVSLFRNQTLELPKLKILNKTLKAARLAIADRVVLNRTNTELLAANMRRIRQAEQTDLQYNGQGARVLSLEDVKERRWLAEKKEKNKEAKAEEKRQKQEHPDPLVVTRGFTRLGPDLIYMGPNLSHQLLLLQKIP